MVRVRGGVAIASILFSFFTLPLCDAEAKDFAGGGGELGTDNDNPWFAYNTKEVPYCIRLDDQHFGASLTQARDAVDYAISYWKQSFAQRVSNTDVPMAGQRFTEVDCGEPHLLSIQFGTLSIPQQKLLGNPRRIVASAVGDVNYDAVNLRRHGFIYVSPETGPFSLEKEDVVPNRWQVSNGRLLKLALIHEFGHVFGVQHRNTSGGVMDRYILARSIGKASYSEFINSSIIPQPFNPIPGSSYRQCEDVKYLAELIGVTDIPGCFDFVSPRRGTVEFYAINTKDKSRVLVGTFEAQFKGNGADAASWYYLPDDQRVFPNRPDGTKRETVVAANYLYWEESGTYVSADGEIRRQMILKYTGEEIDGTVMDANGLPKLHAFLGSAWHN